MMDWLAHRAKISSHKIALMWRDQRWSYAEMDKIVSGYALQLRDGEVKAGTRVAVLLPNCPEYVFIIHALTRLRAILVPLNARLTADEVRWQVGQAACEAIICNQDREEEAVCLLPQEETTVSTPDGKDPRDTPYREEKLSSSSKIFSIDPPQNQIVRALQTYFVELFDFDQHIFDLESTQGIFFTSGTTGFPKCVKLSYANHFWSANASSYRLGIYPDDLWLLCMPLYHVGGIAIVFRCCLYGASVLLQASFDSIQVRDAICKLQVTLVSLVPTMLYRLLEVQQEEFPATLRCILVGGASATEEILNKACKLNVPLALTYGLTEGASQVATAVPSQVLKKPGSVGKPLMFTELKIFDESGSEMYPGEVGEIVIRGPSVMQGYLNQAEINQSKLQNGWLSTGDLGYLDHDGDLWVLQRRTDLILSGGENVYPSQVEKVLLSHPNVFDACVVGIDDPEWGQRVAAVIVPKGILDERALLDYCREKLAGYKIPRMFRFLDKLPQTSSGKVKRDAIQSLFEGD